MRWEGVTCVDQYKVYAKYQDSQHDNIDTRDWELIGVTGKTYFHHSTLACTEYRYCTVLYCTVLYCTVLYCTVQVTGAGYRVSWSTETVASCHTLHTGSGDTGLQLPHMDTGYR